MQDKVILNPVKTPEPKDTRYERRLKKSKQELLATLVNLYFTHTSSLAYPEGEEAAQLFMKYNRMWATECSKFNKLRKPFKLRPEVFTEEVNRILDMEKVTKQKVAEKVRVKDFDHWMRRTPIWLKYNFRTIYYWIKSGFNKEKNKALWKNFYVTHILPNEN